MIKRASRSPRGTSFGWAAAVAVLAAVCSAPLALALAPGRDLTLYSHDVWEAGLPQNTVQSVVQTRDGFLWLATHEGMVRFNGVEFEVFDKKNTPEIRSKSIWTLFEDSRGALWAGTNGGGLVRYQGGRFAVFTTDDGLASNYVYALCEGRDGSLWIGTGGGLSRMSGGRITSLTRKDGLASEVVRAVLEDRAGVIWIGTEGAGLLRYEGGRFSAVAADGLARNVVRALAETRDGSLWIGTYGGGLVRLRDGAAERFSTDRGLSSAHVWTLYEDRQGALWVGTDGGGVNRFADGAFSTFSTREGLSHEFARAVCEDREGSIWIGTNVGLNRLRDGKFTVYTKHSGLSGDGIRAVCEDGAGGVWVGTDSHGLDLLRDGKVVRSYTTRDGLASDRIRSLALDRDGALWIGTNGGGLSRLANDRFTTYTSKDGLPHDVVYAVSVDRAGAVWVGTTGGGLARFESGRFKTFTAADGFPATDVRMIHEDREGAVWIGTSGSGLFRFMDGRFTPFGTGDGFANDSILSIYEDVDGVLWFGTNGGGITRLAEGRFRTFTTADGLFDDNAFQILEDGRGRFWVSCNKGIFRVDKARLNEIAGGGPGRVESTVYSTADGLRANQCNGASQSAGCKTPDGRLWFPTVAGLAVVDPERITLNEQPPPVSLRRVVVDAHELPADAPGELPPDSRKFEFHYEGLSFLAPEKVNFRYRLEGFDDEWVEAGTRRVAFYSSLPPGDYAFHVVACNNDGVWNETGATYRFRLGVPWWRSWWLFAAGAVVLGGATYGGVRLRLQSVRRHNRLLKQSIRARTAELAAAVDELELQKERAVESERAARASEQDALEANRAKSLFLSNMSHELRTPLNAVIGFAQLMGRDTTRPPHDREHLRIIQESGEHLLGLISDVLSIAKIESGTIMFDQHPFDLYQLLRTVEQMLRLRAEAKGLALEVDRDASVPRFVVGDEGKLRQVLINLVGNAVKFTESGTVALSVAWGEGVGRFEVRDTGCGIEPGEIETLFMPFTQTESGRRFAEGTGLGLTISRTYVRHMGGDIEVESRPGEGTAFRFTAQLPAAEGAAAEPRPGGVLGLEPGQPAYRILAVDDRLENRLLLRRLFTSVGFEVREAANGREAVDAWTEWRPHLVWMDMRMPVMDGYEAAREIRRREVVRGPWPMAREEQSPGQLSELSSTDHGPRATDHCKIIGLTASAFEHERGDILAAGCDDVIVKPFRAETLFDAVGRYLGVRFARAGEEAAEAAGPGVAAGIAGLPADVVDELRDAMVRGSANAAGRAIARIRDRNPDLAEELDRLVYDFAYDDVLAMIERHEREGAV